MSGLRSAEYLVGLVRELRKLPRETEWLELKENNADPHMIGEYISALSNAAAIEGKASGFLLWGIRNDDHAIVGTSFEPRSTKYGNEELETWLLRLLEPKLHFRFSSVEVDSQRVALLEIERAQRMPARFDGGRAAERRRSPMRDHLTAGAKNRARRVKTPAFTPCWEFDGHLIGGARRSLPRARAWGEPLA